MKTTDIEEWRIIEEFPTYSVSNKGNVKNNKNNYIMQGGYDRDGYRQVTLSVNKKQYNRRICRLVAIAFIPNPNNLPQVNHKDENKENDLASNLEWCTSLYNNNYGTKGQATRRMVKCIETGKIYNGVRVASRESNIPHQNIGKACKNGCIAGGYHWEYIEEEKMEKSKVFKSYLDTFETDEIRNYCKDMIEKVPDYIFAIPSSTSFKYHNKTQCQPHGQIFHILMFGEIMNYILGLEYVQEKINNPKKRDCLRCTSIFHDAIKCGLNGSQYTVHDHPLLAGEWVRNTIVEHDVDKTIKEYIARLCESHSGQWTTTNRSKTVLPKPETDEQFLVHLCDYLSSRSNIDMTYTEDIYNALGDIEIPKKELPKLDSYVITFGKHNGKTLPKIQECDPGWISWAKENITREPVKTLLSQMK